MNLEWLHSFAEAAKLKSFSKAAQALNLTQPALSKHIRNLEHALEVTLFYRTSGGIELTEAGERFYTRIVPVISDLASIRRELRQYRRNGSSGARKPSKSGYLLPACEAKSLAPFPYFNDPKYIRRPAAIVEGRTA